MSLLVGSMSGGPPPGALKAYCDPVIFRDDRVLQTLLRKESKYIPCLLGDYFRGVQREIKPHNRKEVADWMLEVCEAESAQPEVFVLAMNYLDRFLSVCSISKSQLQLLGGVCLLVSWKVREHQHLPANKLVEYSDFNITMLDIMEWEVLLLSKLDWDMSSVIPSDFVEHIIQRVRKLQLGMSPELVRRHSETLITMCSAHYSFSNLCPSLIAAASVLTTLRPLIEAAGRNRDTPSPSSCSSAGSSPNRPSRDMTGILEVVERITSLEKHLVIDCMDRIEALMRVSLPPSPVSSPKIQRPDSPFGDGGSGNNGELKTPTKVLDVAASHQHHHH